MLLLQVIFPFTMPVCYEIAKRKSLLWPAAKSQAASAAPHMMEAVYNNTWLIRGGLPCVLGVGSYQAHL